MTPPEIEEMIEEFKDLYVKIEEVMDVSVLEKYEQWLRTTLTTLHQKHQGKLDPIRVSMFRQWVNEDRIINNPHKKLVSDEDIIFWLTTKSDKQTEI